MSESAKPHGTLKLLRITDIQDNSVNWQTVPYTDLDKSKSEKYLLQNGDIVFARTGATVGKSYLIDNIELNSIYASYLIKIDVFKQTLSKYVKNYFDSGYYWEQIAANSVGIGQPNVNSTVLGNLYIPIPPIAEQYRIVESIEQTFALIDGIKANKSDLSQAIKQTKAKVLDLAIRGKLVPQDPNDEPASVLLERIKAEKETSTKGGKKQQKQPASTSDNSHYEKMPFEIPDSWAWTVLGKVGTWQSGSTPSRLRKDYYDGCIPWLKTGDLNDGVIDTIPESISDLALQETSVKLNPSGSVLMAMYGATIGKLGVLSTPATTNQACCACYVYKGIVNTYLFYFLLSNRLKFIRMGGGGAQPNISKEKIISTTLPIPPYTEQHKIAAKIDILFNLLNSLEGSLQ